MLVLPLLILLQSHELTASRTVIFMLQSVYADGPAYDGPTLPPPQRLPGE